MSQPPLGFSIQFLNLTISFQQDNLFKDENVYYGYTHNRHMLIIAITAFLVYN